MTGEVGILNVGAGDTKLTFNSDDPAETVRAGRIVKDMLRRGYMLLVEGPDGKYTRAEAFDENTNEYIIADFDPLQEVEDEDEPKESEGKATTPRKAARKKKGKKKTRRVPARKTSAVAVSKIAGG